MKIGPWEISKVKFKTQNWLGYIEAYIEKACLSKTYREGASDNGRYL